MGFLQHNYSYHYSYNYGNSDMEEFVRTMDILLPIYGAMLIFSVALGLLIYVFNSLSLMTIAKRRGLTSPWISWIPFCSGYALGKISDDINAKGGKRSSHRKVLLSLTIVTDACIFLSMAMILAPLFSLFSFILRNGYVPATYDVDELAVQLVLGFGLLMIGAIIAIINVIFYYIALYNVFKAYAPNNAVLFLVLSILISICSTIFLFVIRNHVPVDPLPPAGYYPPNGYNNPYQTYTPNQQYPPQYQQPPYQNNGYQTYTPPQQGGYQTYQPNVPSQNQPDDNRDQQNPQQ